MESKRIAIVCDYKLLQERVGGMDYFFWQFNKKCQENDVAVDWFFPNNETHGFYTTFSIISAPNTSIEATFLEHLTKEKTKYDYIITHFLELCTPFYKKVKQKSAAKIIAIDHNPRPLQGYSFKKKLQKKMKGILYSKYIDTFVGVSQYTVHELLHDFGTFIAPKTKVIYNGVIIDDIVERTSQNLRPTQFIVASHLRYSKGIQDLLLAWSQLPEQITHHCSIDIYGEGEYEDVLREMCKNLQLTNIYFKGSVSNLKQLFHKYDFLLQPTYMECFSLSILESLAANVPVITTNVGGNEEVVKNGVNGFIFCAQNVTQLTALLTKVIGGELTINQNTRNLIATHYSLESMVENHFKLIN
ncbi:glycosyltransferase family 4 protein [Flavobacterium croceum]|uniref:glycosyltransferase family 4 protein n=1 Tax=Flavobacterium croceum TaxID=370975 RepID=UPI0024A7D1D7|nr:glycosyltransferase family 4 protein [Flavobacterium croceum]